MSILETERLALREFTADDTDFILELLNESSFIQNIGDRGVRTQEDALKYIEKVFASYARNGFGLWLVKLKQTGESIGMCGLIKRDELKDVDLGYAFLPRFWSKGYAVEAALGSIEYARLTVGLKRVVAIVDPLNQPSIRLLEKIGFTFEKMIRLADDDVELKLFGCTL